MYICENMILFDFWQLQRTTGHDFVFKIFSKSLRTTHPQLAAWAFKHLCDIRNLGWFIGISPRFIGLSKTPSQIRLHAETLYIVSAPPGRKQHETPWNLGEWNNMKKNDYLGNLHVLFLSYLPKKKTCHVFLKFCFGPLIINICLLNFCIKLYCFLCFFLPTKIRAVLGKIPRCLRPMGCPLCHLPAGDAGWRGWSSITSTFFATKTQALWRSKLGGQLRPPPKSLSGWWLSSRFIFSN